MQMPKLVMLGALVTLFLASAKPSWAAQASPKHLCDEFEGLGFELDPQKCKSWEGRDAKVRTLREKIQKSKQQCRELLSYSLSHKRIRLERSAADQCLKAYRDYSKDALRSKAAWLAARTACDAAIVGLARSGEVCDSAFECAPGLVCRGDKGGPPGRCQAVLNIGDACDDDALNASALHALLLDARGSCGAGAHCGISKDGSLRCAKDLALGAACSGSQDTKACGPGHACVGGICKLQDKQPSGGSCLSEEGCGLEFTCKNGSCIDKSVAKTACHQDQDCLGRCVKGRCQPFCGSK